MSSGTSRVTTPPGAHHHARADRRSRQHDRPASKTAIIADANRRAVLQARRAHLRVERMRRRQQLHPRPDEAPVADRHRAHVEHHAAEAHVEPLAGGDARAIVAMKGRLDLDARADMRQQLAQDRLAGGRAGGIGGVEPMHQRPRAGARLGKLRIGRVVELASEHALAHGRGRGPGGAPQS